MLKVSKPVGLVILEYKFWYLIRCDMIFAQEFCDCDSWLKIETEAIMELFRYGCSYKNTLYCTDILYYFT